LSTRLFELSRLSRLGFWKFHFPIRRGLAVYKCRQVSVLGFASGILGSSRSVIGLRPLGVSDCISWITRLYSGLSDSPSGSRNGARMVKNPSQYHCSAHVDDKLSVRNLHIGGFGRGSCYRMHRKRNMRRMRNLQRPYLQGSTVSC